MKGGKGLSKANEMKVGIGFATGRKSFQKVLRSYINNWKESGLVQDREVNLNLFVAFDLSYNKTKKTDYTRIQPELAKCLNDVTFIGRENISKEAERLVRKGVTTSEEAKLIFGKGYAAQRNIVLYNAIKNHMDYLIFLDDDEYPVAVTSTRETAIWGGQHVLTTHLKFIGQADITHGRHCGYISPIPYMEYNESMTENDFRTFIEAISNDILNWDNIRKVIQRGGITYADTDILRSTEPEVVEEINHAKFISGANLCINLTDPKRVFPFYNPPAARGEDTFLSTCLKDRRVLRLPCYTFHDGFSTYNHLLEGVLPIRLKPIRGDNDVIINRFYKACLGWIRYKPLLLYITHKEDYEDRIERIRMQLNATLPIVCAYFQRPDFMTILKEFEKYNRNVKKHYTQYCETQEIWARIMDSFKER